MSEGNPQTDKEDDPAGLEKMYIDSSITIGISEHHKYEDEDEDDTNKDETSSSTVANLKCHTFGRKQKELRDRPDVSQLKNAPSTRQHQTSNDIESSLLASNIEVGAFQKRYRFDQSEDNQAPKRPKHAKRPVKQVDFEAESYHDDTVLDKEYTQLTQSGSNDNSGNGSMLAWERNKKSIRSTSGMQRQDYGGWTTYETKALERGFHQNLINGTCPNHHEVIEAVKLSPFLKRRSYRRVKCKVQDIIKTRDKVISKALFKTFKAKL